jgi:hypothetical protein
MIPTRALSLLQPYPFFVVDPRNPFPKRIENRSRLVATWPSWSPPGDFWVHAAKGDDEVYWATAIERARRAFPGGLFVPKRESLPRGGIVGRARIVGTILPANDFRSRTTVCGTGTAAPRYEDVRDLDYRWHFPESPAYVLGDVVPCEFVPCRGMQGFFPLRPDVLRALEKIA